MIKTKKNIFLFSKSGFTNDLINYYEDNIRLIDFNTLFEG